MTTPSKLSPEQCAEITARHDEDVADAIECGYVDPTCHHDRAALLSHIAALDADILMLRIIEQSALTMAARLTAVDKKVASMIDELERYRATR